MSGFGRHARRLARTVATGYGSVVFRDLLPLKLENWGSNPVEDPGNTPLNDDLGDLSATVVTSWNELIDAAATAGAPAIVAVPIGFMTDHMETLYDLDIVAAGKALDLDMEFVRAPVPNDDESVVAGLARSVSALL